jgi:hypothetical protein
MTQMRPMSPGLATLAEVAKIVTALTAAGAAIAMINIAVAIRPRRRAALHRRFILAG